MPKMRIGFKVTPTSKQDGIGDYYRDLIAARCPIGVMSMDAAGPCHEVQELAKRAGYKPDDTFIHFRRTGISGSRFIDVPDYNLAPKEAAHNDWAVHLALWNESPELEDKWVWYGINNELDQNRSEWIAEYSIELCKIALAAGKKITVMDWSTGTPDYSAWTKPKMVELLALLRKHPDQLALGLHEYSLVEDSLYDTANGKPVDNHLIGRWTEIPGIKGVSVFFTEWGWAERGAPPAEVGVQQLVHAYTHYYAYPECKGLALWTLDRNWGQLHETMNSYIPLLKQVVPATEVPGLTFPDDEIPPGTGGSMEQIIVPDISKWQGTIDFKKMKAKGAKGVLVRASYGDGTGIYEDQRLREYMPKILEAGLPWGLYHYLHPKQNVMTQLGLFSSLVADYPPHLGAWVDLEENGGVYAAWAAEVEAGMSLLKQQASRDDSTNIVGIYTSPGYWTGTMKSPSWGKKYALWLAQWTTASSPAVPFPWDKNEWVFWQYTSSEPGAPWGVQSSRIDLNRFNGTLEDFEELIARGAPSQITRVVVKLPQSTNKAQAEKIAGWRHGARNDIVYSIDSLQALMDHPDTGPNSKVVVYGYYLHSAEEKRILDGYDLEKKTMPGPFTTQEKPDPPSQPDPPPATPKMWPIYKCFVTPNMQPSPFMVLGHKAGPHAGQTEDVQLQPAENRIVKNRNYERIWVQGDYIYRAEDTSHGPDTFYTLQDDVGSQGHKWLPSNMEANKPYKRTAIVRIRRKKDCVLLNEYTDVTYAVLKSSPGGVVQFSTTVGNRDIMGVYEVVVSHKADGSNPFERYWYAEGLGLIAWWDLVSGAHSVIVDFPAGREPLVPDELKC